ncbi:hypothetical protein [Pedobacter metabolipauper]|uniref:DUF1444 family protein n=1 Tax=Pedobacter metabolipauper TaxID=425513 RepID=A0A4V6PW25_9SPHI|nr:hypothetical protein [Pedobacter metabolipauper]TDQ11403.1 hypothetical protein ATK78_0524 [Pedobacter metabolipauper]
MGFFDKLFKKEVAEPLVNVIDKAKVLVYPMIKSSDWKGMGLARSQPFLDIDGKPELALVFAQDAGDSFQYITEADLLLPGVQENFDQWQHNINTYPYEITLAKSLDNRVITASGEDHSAEKVLSAAFLAEACAALNTDRLVISIPRRRCLMITSYYEDFQSLENFFRLHFLAWQEEDYGNEQISEMVFLADKNKIEYAVPLGFRINLYERDGQFKLVYSTMDDLFQENDQIDFQKIMEKNKIPVSIYNSGTSSGN